MKPIYTVISTHLSKQARLAARSVTANFEEMIIFSEGKLRRCAPVKAVTGSLPLCEDYIIRRKLRSVCIYMDELLDDENFLGAAHRMASKGVMIELECSRGVVFPERTCERKALHVPASLFWVRIGSLASMAAAIQAFKEEIPSCAELGVSLDFAGFNYSALAKQAKACRKIGIRKIRINPRPPVSSSLKCIRTLDCPQCVIKAGKVDKSRWPYRRDEYEAAYAAHKNPWHIPHTFKTNFRDVTDYLFRRLVSGKNFRWIVDCGSGPDDFRRIFPRSPAVYVCADISPSSLLRCSRGTAPVASDMESLPFADERFSLAIYSDSLFLTSAEKSVFEAHRILRPGGILFLANRSFIYPDCFTFDQAAAMALGKGRKWRLLHRYLIACLGCSTLTDVLVAEKLR